MAIPSKIPVHLHISWIHALFTLLELLIVWIPIKIVAANYQGRSGFANATLHVL